MNKPRKHHHVPVMMLKNFTDDEGKFWFFEKEYLTLKRYGPKARFWIEDLNTVISATGLMDVTI